MTNEASKTVITRAQLDSLAVQLGIGRSRMGNILASTGIEVEPEPVSPRALRTVLARIVFANVDVSNGTFDEGDILDMFDSAVREVSK